MELTIEDLDFMIRKIALQHHLRYNHYPPIDSMFIPAAEEAITKANMENWNDIIHMPNGKELSVAEIVEGLHLESFLEERE